MTCKAQLADGEGFLLFSARRDDLFSDDADIHLRRDAEPEPSVAPILNGRAAGYGLETPETVFDGVRHRATPSDLAVDVAFHSGSRGDLGPEVAASG